MLMFVNSNSYPLFIKKFVGFKIAQKERGYYYDKTLKKRIWLYTFNLRRNLFFTLKELIPFQSAIGANSITIPVNIETVYKTAQSDLLTYKRIYLNKYLAKKRITDTIYARLATLRNKEMKACLISQDVNFTSFSLDSNHIFNTSGNIHKVSRVFRQELQIYRYMLKNAPYKFWNSYSDFVKVIDELTTSLINLRKTTFFDFITSMNLAFTRLKVLKHFRKKKPWNNTLFLWNLAFEKIYLINKLIFKKFTKDSKLTNLLSNHWENLLVSKAKKIRYTTLLIISKKLMINFFSFVKKLHKGKLIFTKYNKFITNKNLRKKEKKVKIKKRIKRISFLNRKKSFYLEQQQRLWKRKNFINDLVLFSKY